MTKREAIQFVLVRSLGNFLLLFSLYGVLATFGPVILAEAHFRITQARGTTYQIVCHSCESRNPENVSSELDPRVREDDRKSNQKNGFVDVLIGSKEQILIPKDTIFSISIAKIGASSRVIPNVDPGNADEFLRSLQQGVAHAKGSVFPGMQGNVYLFAHSADNWWNAGRYNAVFYLLKDLSEGDEIVVFFENRRYEYVVTQKMISEPQDISLLTQRQTGHERLVLQTCWPPGTTWKRLYIIAEPK